MGPAKASIVALATGLLVCACGGKPPPAPGSAAPTAEEGAYLAPPMPDAVRLVGTRVSLSGVSQPGARVRLATPQGQAMFSDADSQGRWTIALGDGGAPRIFGLSATAKGRQAQSEGYILVTPRGEAAVLRAGAGARRIDAAKGPGLRAIDFDRGGGVEVSALTPPGATVILRLDGRQVAQGRSDAKGHYEVGLPPLGSTTPIQPGSHQIQIYGDGFTDTVGFQISRAAPLAQGPFSSQLTSAGLRVDWMTPGGGVQSTILTN